MSKREMEPNIAPELFKAWQLLRRDGDVSILVELTGVSRPTIDNALLRGYVLKDGLVDKINAFFENRIKQEQATAKKLLEEFTGDVQECDATEAATT